MLPLPKDDLIALLCDEVDAKRDTFSDALRVVVRGREHGPMKDINNSQTSPLNYAGSGAHHQLLVNLTSVLNEPLRQAIENAVNSWVDFPADGGEVGPPRAERVKEIAKLDKEIAGIEDKLLELQSAARDAGVRIEHRQWGSKQDRS